MAKQDYISAIAHCSALNILPHTARGNFVMFLINWISAGCRPIDISQLQMVIGMRDNVWERYKDSLNHVAEVIIPELQRIHERKLKEKTLFDKYNSNRRLNRIKKHTFTDTDISIQEQEKRPKRLSHSPEYVASHPENKQKSNTFTPDSPGMMED